MSQLKGSGALGPQLGVWGRIAPILAFFLPSLLFAERGQQGGFESLFFYFYGGLGAEPP